jgi:pimeloyl-ACP methyl ester carboxylesterase
MKPIYNILIIIVIFSALPRSASAGSDLAKEKRWSEQIVDSLLTGESVQLEAAGTPFLGIYTEASQGKTGYAVILAHGIGVHPDWPEVIHPLRSMLPEHGWSTLSIQMPVLPNDAELKDYLPLFDEAGPRIESALQFLRQQGNQTVVVLGHSLGAAMAASYLAGDGQRGIQGFIAVGMGVIQLDDKMNSALALEKIRIPVFDLYGSRDLADVRSSATRRKTAAQKSGNRSYRQLEIEGADHFFMGMEDELVRRVYGWLVALSRTNKEKTP